MTVSLRRGFVDVAGGQVHYREAGSGGTRPFVLLHASPGSGKMLVPLLLAMAATRRTIALDTRGNGDSSPLPIAEPGIADFAEAALEALDELGVAQFDLFGTHTGASIAMETAIQRPDRVRRLILDSMGLWSTQQRDEHLEKNAPMVAPDAIGSQFNWAFHYCRDQYLFWPWYRHTADARRSIGLPPAQALHDVAIEVLKALGTYHMSYRAAARHPKRERLPLLRVPTLATSTPTDSLIAYLDEVAQLVPGAERAVAGDPETHDGARASALVYAAFLDRLAGEDDRPG